MDLMSEFADVGQYDPSSPKPGHYLDVPNDVYHSANIITKSKLDDVHQSLSTYRQRRDTPRHLDKTKALDFGSAGHALFVEPDLFHSEYVVMPNYNLRTNKGKDDKAKFEQENADKTIITQDDFERIKFMVKSMQANPILAHWLTQDGWAESVVVVELNGVMVQVRPDYMVETESHVIVPDLKFVQTMDHFEREFLNYRYHVQNAMYADAIEKHFNKPCFFFFGVVQKDFNAGKIPVDCFECPQEFIELGRDEYQADLEKLSQAMKTDNWLETRTVNIRRKLK